jgi:hypothetical protein
MLCILKSVEFKSRMAAEGQSLNQNWVTEHVRAQGYEAREAFFALNINHPQYREH